jgi:hypothetical protein
MDLKLLQDTPPWDWPRGAGKTFLGILRNPQADASDRLIAADLAGDLVVMNDALADALLFIVANAAEPEQLRANAAISLGPVLEQADIDEFDDPGAVPISEKTFRVIKQALRKAYLDSTAPKLLRRRILEASVRAQEEWHPGAIRAAWSGDDPEWKLTAAFCMNYVNGFEKEIVEALESPDPDTRYQAVRAAGNWEVDEAWPHVAALITAPDTDKDLLLAAIEAVSTIRPREARLLLVDLAESEDEDIADAVEEAMSMADGLVDDDDDDEDVEFDDEEDEEDDEDEDPETIH